MLRGLSYANPLYGLSLMGPAPQHLTRLPPEAWAGDPAIGHAILAGELRCLGQPIDLARPDWHGATRPAAVAGDLNAFGWLDHLAAAGGGAAQTVARDLVLDWIDGDRGWQPIAWRADVLGRRCAAWLAHARFLSRGEGDELGPKLLASLARQVRHLARVAGKEMPGLARLEALRGLIYATQCGIGRDKQVERALALLASELPGQVRADGGHVERSPTATLAALIALADIREMLALADRPPMSALDAALDGLATGLRGVRHGDGGFALFNGSSEDDPRFIDRALTRAGSRATPPGCGMVMGFHRIAAGKTVLLVDAAAPPREGLDARAHAGTLSFELSVAKARLIVNCGAHLGADPAWRSAMRATAAHSTLAVDDTNSSELLDEGGLGRRPTNVACKREELEGNVWLALSHDGYQHPFGLVHHRALWLAAAGDDLRGEDRLEGGHRGVVALRFHLHPEVHTSLIQSGSAVLLRLPSKDHWKLQVGEGTLKLADSVYLGRGGQTRRAEQVVIERKLDGHGASIKWALKRIAKS